MARNNEAKSHEGRTPVEATFTRKDMARLFHRSGRTIARAEPALGLQVRRKNARVLHYGLSAVETLLAAGRTIDRNEARKLGIDVDEMLRKPSAIRIQPYSGGASAVGPTDHAAMAEAILAFLESARCRSSPAGSAVAALVSGKARRAAFERVLQGVFELIECGSVEVNRREDGGATR